MTREEARKYIKDNFGVEEPTDEQISKLLNTMNKDDKKIEDLKEKAKLADDLQKQIDEINESKLSEAEKAQKALEDGNKKIANLEKQIQTMTFKNELAKRGIVGEDADKLLKEDGSLDIEILGKIITDRETQAKAQAEKDLLDKTPDPKGGNGDEGDGKDDPLVKSVVENITNSIKASNDIINAYK